jgi:hypothetical protein
MRDKRDKRGKGVCERAWYPYKRGCRGVQSRCKLPPGHVFLKKCAKRAVSAKSPLLTFRLAGFSSITETLLQNLARAEHLPYGWNPLLTGDKRDDMPTHQVLAIVPFVIRRPWSSEHPGGVAFLKLSKLLNQEDALSAPFLPRESRSPQARPRGAHPCWGQA